MFIVFKNEVKPNKNLYKYNFNNKKVDIPSINSTDNSSGSSRNDILSLSKDNIKFLGKKVLCVRKQGIFKIENEIIIKKNNGIWSDEEHKKFIEALYIYNCKWPKIIKYIPTRTPDQLRSHAQKFYLRLKEFKDDSLGLDFTLETIKNLNDIIDIVKKKESLSNNKDKLLFILSEKLRFGKKIKKKETKSLLSNDNSENKNDIIIELDEYIDKNVNNDDTGNDSENEYFWKNQDKSDLSVDTFSFGLDNKINDFIYYRKISL